MSPHCSIRRREAAVRVSAMILDIDHFKAVNDAHGHDAGDAGFEDFRGAGQARRCAAPICMCRFGGEEFVVIMPDTRLPVAKMVGERMRAAVAGVALSDRERRARHCRDGVDRHRRKPARRHARRLVQARRPGAVPVENRRPQPRHRRRRLTLAQATSQFEIPRPAPGRIPHTHLKVGLRREGDLRGRHLQGPLDANGAEIRGGA